MGSLAKSGFPLLICITVESMTSPIVTTQGKNGFLHANKRRSSTIKTIDLPRVARSMFTLIGSCRIYSIFQIKAGSLFSILLLSQTPVNNIFEQIASKHTSQRSENSTRLKTIHCDQR